MKIIHGLRILVNFALDRSALGQNWAQQGFSGKHTVYIFNSILHNYEFQNLPEALILILIKYARESKQKLQTLI